MDVMLGRHSLHDMHDDGCLEDGYYEDDYIPKVESNMGDGYEEEFKKAVSVLEQKHNHSRNGEVHTICDSQIKGAEDELYLKKVNLYRSVANKQSLTRRSIDSDLDKLSSSLLSSKERWSSQTDVNDEYVSLQPPDKSQNTSHSSLQVSANPIRSSHSSNSLQSDNCKLSSNKLNGSATSLPLNRTLSNLSLQAKRLNKSNSSVDSSCSLPDGWEKVESKTGVYYWHVPSGTTQYQHPSLSSNQDLSEKVSQLQISTPETEEQSTDTVSRDQNVPRDQDTASQLPPDQHKVINLGYMDMDISTLKAANSSVAINECIRKLSSIMHDPSQTENLLQILVFEGTFLKLLDYSSKAVLSKQNILTVRRWGVGSDDVRNFAYVVKQKATNSYRCFVLHCHHPASHIALQMKNICKVAAEKREEETAMSASSEQNAAALTPTSPTAAVPAPPPQQPCRFETLYLGYIRVEKEKGTDVIHAAIEKLENSNQTNWESVTMEIHVSTINLIKTADRTLLAEHRVRFVSFMALGKQEHHLGYIVHGGPRIFYCHVYQSDSSCADMARAIQNACNARYQLLLAKQEEIKKSQKPESTGILSFWKRLKKKSPEAERQSMATKG
ncbi:hypothetical protein ACHWQZ_G001548 [Mnemiopsis leidyi]